MIDIENFAKDASDFATYMEWEKDWSRGGCYIHLEVSEFIEALRGKGDPIEELGDALYAICAVAKNYKLSINEALKRSRIKMKKIMIEKEKEYFKT